MDEDYFNKRMTDEQREAKAATYGCGMLALIVAVVSAIIIIIIKIMV